MNIEDVMQKACRQHAKCFDGQHDRDLRAAIESLVRERDTAVATVNSIREYPCANGKQHEPAKVCLYCERDEAVDKWRELHDYRHPMCDISDDIIWWAADHIQGKKCVDEASLIASLRKIANIGPVSRYNGEVELRQRAEKQRDEAVALLRDMLTGIEVLRSGMADKNAKAFLDKIDAKHNEKETP